ncbi:unnamed protein product [marine sediment metagenome]|uniref:Zinc-ribbon domain-containing protein n=1 Tax=marine sediment metagenome TaxID=412755 RepID=X1DGZ9_9ZZZZ
MTENGLSESDVRNIVAGALQEAQKLNQNNPKNEKDSAGTGFKCPECGASLSAYQTPCPSCHATIEWGD